MESTAPQKGSSTSRKIGVASLIWAAGILASRVIGLVRDIVLGRQLGAGEQADAYQSAFTIPDWVNYLMAGGALSIVFIPIFARHVVENREDEGWKAFSGIANASILIFLVLGGITFAVAPELVAWTVPGFGAEQQALVVRLTRIVLPAQLFIILGGLLQGVLQARDQHGVSALTPLLYNLGVVAGGLVLGPSLGAEGFAWGVLAGALLGNFGVPLVVNLRAGMRWSFGGLGHPDVKAWLLASLPIMLGQSIVMYDDWLTRNAGSLVGVGVVALLGYSKTLMRVPMAIFGQAAGAAAYPTLARLVAEGKPKEAWDALAASARMVLVLSFASQAAFTVAGGDVARVIWGGGRFSPEELDKIGLYTGLYCLSLGAWGAANLFGRGFYAKGKNWGPTLWGTALTIVGIPVYRLAGSEGGGVGLVLASSASITLYTVVLAVWLRRELQGESGFSGLLLRMVPATALGIAVAWPVVGLDLPPLLRGALSGALALGITLGAGALFGVPEVRALSGKVLRRLRR